MFVNASNRIDLLAQAIRASAYRCLIQSFETVRRFGIGQSFNTGLSLQTVQNSAYVGQKAKG